MNHTGNNKPKDGIQFLTIDQHIIKAFVSDDRVEAVYLLGSAVNGHLRPDSDIDIAILPAMNRHLDVFVRNSIASSLALKLGREVDTGILSSENLVYAYQAIMTGRRVFARNPLAVDKIVACLLGMYGQFNFDRREVCNAYSS